MDLTTLNSGVTKRDQDMQQPQYLDTANEANKFAVFEMKSIEVPGPSGLGPRAQPRFLPRQIC